MARPTAPATIELQKVMDQVTVELISMIDAGYHGHVTIHLGAGQVRVEVQRNMPVVRLTVEARDVMVAAG